MNKRMLKWVFFALTVCLGFGVPGAMIYKQMKALEEGTIVKVKTRPIDPYDPFRGRYVQLAFDVLEVEIADAAEAVERGRTIYVSIELDSDGYAKFGDATIAKPGTGLFLEAKAGYRATDTSNRINLPFDRYYMNEEIAPEAERLYRERNRVNFQLEESENEEDRGNYVTVRVLDGYAAIEGLYLEHKPIEKLVREWLEAEQKDTNP